MKALVVRSLSADFSGCAVEDRPEPVVGPGQIRVRVRAASVNFPDILMTRGEYQMKPELPFTPGLDIAGEVESLGAGGSRFSLGQPVVGGARLGGFAELAVLAEEAVSVKPAALSFDQAAAYPAAYLTAYVALVRRAAARPGEWLLVHGAAGGVGLAAVDLGLQLGLRVIAASASDEKLAVIKAAYAPDALVNVTGGFRTAVKAITGGAGADIIFDPVGGDVFDESVRCIAFNGRLLSIGFTSGRLPTLPVNLALIKGFSLMGVRAGEYGRQFPELGRENVRAVAELAASGAVRPRVHASLPLERWREAFDLLVERRVVGKAILRP
jgi:NADPH2:quinone reductase